MTRYFAFIGVTTAQSSIMPVFPAWTQLLGLGTDVRIHGYDLALHATPATYRSVVGRIKREPAQIGGLVTAHKLDLFESSCELFDALDATSLLSGEISCISKRDGRLHGWAKDPTSAGRALDQLLGQDYFARTNGQVLCFGAGGAGVAISIHLLTGPNPACRPMRLTITDTLRGRLDHLRDIHQKLSTTVPVEYVHVENAADNDRLMQILPAGSVVINASGLGKDAPGSPVSEGAPFPESSIAWEINYRGSLEFLHQAWRQRHARGVRVADGWSYFLFGWAAALEEVFQRTIGPVDIDRMSKAAEFARPSLPTSGSGDIASRLTE